MSDDEVKIKLRGMPLAHAFRWCSGGLCACLGCANHIGATREQWLRCLQEMVKGCETGTALWTETEKRQLDAALSTAFEPPTQ